jgi:hypothetical protein
VDFKIGDRVSFLNDIGGGIVTGIKDKNTIIITDDIGFNTPYNIKQLVKINAPAAANPEKNALQDILNQNDDMIAIIYTPKNSADTITSDLDLIILNNTPYTCNFDLCIAEAGKMIHLAHHRIPAKNSFLVKQIARIDIENYTRLKFQCILSSPKKFESIEPISQNIIIKATKFFKETSYKTYSFSPFPSLVHIIASHQDLQNLITNDIHLITDEITPKKISANQKNISLPHHHLRISKEVDLHIVELIEKVEGLAPHQLLQIQLNHFKKELDNAINQNYDKITFIHGVGTGKLKTELQQLIKEYTGIKSYPASFQKYGAGATTIEII